MSNKLYKSNKRLDVMTDRELFLCRKHRGMDITITIPWQIGRHTANEMEKRGLITRVRKQDNPDCWERTSMKHGIGYYRIVRNPLSPRNKQGRTPEAGILASVESHPSYADTHLCDSNDTPASREGKSTVRGEVPQ